MNIKYFNTVLELYSYIQSNSGEIIALSPNQLGDLICDLATLLHKYEESAVINILEFVLVCILESNQFVVNHRIGLNALFNHYYSSDDGISFSNRLINSGASTFFINTLHSYHFNLNYCIDKPPVENPTTLRTKYRNIIADAIIRCSNIGELKDYIASMPPNSLLPYSLGCIILGLASLLFKYPESAILEILELALLALLDLLTLLDLLSIIQILYFNTTMIISISMIVIADIVMLLIHLVFS